MREVAPAEWDEALELDAYYRRAVRRERGAARPGGRFLLEHDGATSRGIEREDPRDVITPVRLRRADADAAASGAYEDWARERASCSTFVRFHPLLANQRRAR